MNKINHGMNYFNKDLLNNSLKKSNPNCTDCILINTYTIMLYRYCTNLSQQYGSLHLYATVAARGLRAGNRKRKDSIIENTTVHSHSSTAGTIHSYRPTITMWVEGWVYQGLPTFISEPKAVELLYFHAPMKICQVSTRRLETNSWLKVRHCWGK